MADSSPPASDAPAPAVAPAAAQAAPHADAASSPANPAAVGSNAVPAAPAAASVASDASSAAPTATDALASTATGAAAGGSTPTSTSAAPAPVPEPELFSIMNIAWFRPADSSMYGSRNAARAEVANRTIKALLAAGLKVCIVQYTCLEDVPAMLALWRRIDFRRTQLQGGLPHTTPRGRLPPLSSTGIMVVELPAPMIPGAPYVVPHVVEELHASPAFASEWPVPAKLIWAPPPPEKFKLEDEFTALIGRINCLISFWNGNA